MLDFNLSEIKEKLGHFKRLYPDIIDDADVRFDQGIMTEVVEFRSGRTYQRYELEEFLEDFGGHLAIVIVTFKKDRGE